MGIVKEKLTLTGSICSSATLKRTCNFAPRSARVGYSYRPDTTQNPIRLWFVKIMFRYYWQIGSASLAANQDLTRSSLTQMKPEPLWHHQPRSLTNVLSTSHENLTCRFWCALKP